jgi:hypothetical protein
MKVYIGKYKHYFGPYQLADLLCFWAKPVKDEYGIESKPEWVHHFGEWLAHGNIEPEPAVGDIRKWGDDRPQTWLYRFLLWINRFRKQRIQVRIDRWDTWSMDYTLSYIVLPMLKQMKDQKQGVPYVDDEDVPEHLRSTAAPALTEEQINTGHVDDNHEARWNWVLDEMIHSFETKTGSLQDWEYQFTTGEYDCQFKTIDEKGTAEMVRGPNHTAETNWDARKAYQDRISNGFRLFGKYYEGLWT